MTGRPAGRLTIVVALFASTLSGPAAAPADKVRQDSFELLNQGVAAVNRGDYPTAVEKLQLCASMALNSFRAHYYLGVALIGERRYADAIGALRIALDLDPSHLQAHVALGDAFLNLGDTDEALAEYVRALKLRPEFPQSLDGIGRVYEAKSDEAKAEQYFKRAIESNRGYAEAYTHLGDLYLELGRLDEAVALLVEAVKVRPDFADGLNRLALAYSRLGLHNEAVSTVQEAIVLEPKVPDHWATLGEIELDLALLDRAAGSFESALALDASHPQARAGTAEIARRRGDYDQAAAQLGIALADDRLKSTTRKWLEGRLAVITSEKDRTAGIEARIAGGTAGPEDYRGLAAIYAERLSWDTAAHYQALAEPTRTEEERLAYYLFRAGSYREAHGLYVALAQSRPSADLEVNAGVALARLGDDSGARDAYARALVMSPGHSLALLYEGNALLRLGRREEAVRSYHAFLDGGGQGEAAERIRRILKQIDPQAASDLPPTPPAIPALVEGEEEPGS
jgi:tetratricopeptide (TPR) repeat protein